MPAVDQRHATGKAVAVGVLAGAMSGLFGIGGGTVIVPGLVMVAGLGQRLAHGTSLAAIVPIAVAGVGGYALDGKVDWIVAGLLVAGSLVGARIGTNLLHRLDQHQLRIGFAIVLLFAAIRLAVEDGGGGGAIDVDVAAGVGLALTGLVAGILAGLMGVGGGVVMVPAQVLFFGIGEVVAKGTSLAVIIPTAVVGTSRNLANGNADLRLAGAVGVAGVVTAFGASRVAIGLSPVLSNVLFALLLSAVSLKMLLQRRTEDD